MLTDPYVMLTKRQQLQQQQLIYGGGSTLPIRGVRSELNRHPEPNKKQAKEIVSLPSPPKNSNSQKPFLPSPPKNGEPKIQAGKKSEMKSLLDSQQKTPDAKGDAPKLDSKEVKVWRRRQRPPAYIPPIHYGEKHVPKNIVTIDTSKARGNTDVLRLVARDLGWREFPVPRRDHNCDVIWHAIGFNDQPDIFSGQVNKFPGAMEVFHKVSLFRQLMLMRQLFPDDFDFFPRTWVLPAQFHEFCNDVRQMAEKKPKPKPTFIVKPSEGSQGEGIYLLRDPGNFSPHPSRSHVAQDYLVDVLLIDGFKFDLRVYVVVKSLDPLEVHICNEGLARFSTLPYEKPTNKNLHETFMHLTNYSLNKRSATFNKSDKDDEGSKRKMTAVFRRMERMGHDTQTLWSQIESIVCKTLIAVAGELKVEYQASLPPGKPHPSCFQVLGFDILVLNDLKAVLLEVNSNPSLSIMAEQEVSPGVVEYLPSAKDEDVKRTLIRDTLILVAPKHKHTRKRRKRRQLRQRPGVEAMEVDSGSVAETKHRNHRERDITIRFMPDDGPDSGDKQRSIFAETDKARPVYQRQETCRVFVEGEGEVTCFNTPRYYQHPDKNSNANRKSQTAGDDSKVKDVSRQSRSAKDPFFVDASDRQLSNLRRARGERPAEAFMEDDSPAMRPLPYDPSLAESSEDENEAEEESCLKEVFPALYADALKHTRLLERLADIFVNCLSVRGCLRMGPTAFRMFARKCRLNRKGMNNASIDIMYIDMQRKWEFLNPDRTSGLCFQGFVDACIEISRRKFLSAQLSETLERLISYCEDSFRGRTHDDIDDDDIKRERISPRIPRPQRRSVTLFPRRTITSLEEETVKDLFDAAMLKRQRSETNDINNFMREMRNRTYVPSGLTGLNSNTTRDDYEYE